MTKWFFSINKWLSLTCCCLINLYGLSFYIFRIWVSVWWFFGGVIFIQKEKMHKHCRYLSVRLMLRVRAEACSGGLTLSIALAMTGGWGGGGGTGACPNDSWLNISWRMIEIRQMSTSFTRAWPNMKLIPWRPGEVRKSTGAGNRNNGAEIAN